MARTIDPDALKATPETPAPDAPADVAAGAAPPSPADGVASATTDAPAPASDMKLDAAGGAIAPPAPAATVPATISAEANPTPETIAVAERLKKGQKAIIYNPNPRQLRDPHTEDRFPPGVTVRVKELGNWTICQIEAGILRVGKADDLGLKSDDNSDFQADSDKK